MFTSILEHACPEICFIQIIQSYYTSAEFWQFMGGFKFVQAATNFEWSSLAQYQV